MICATTCGADDSSSAKFTYPMPHALAQASPTAAVATPDDTFDDSENPSMNDLRNLSDVTKPSHKVQPQSRENVPVDLDEFPSVHANKNGEDNEQAKRPQDDSGVPTTVITTPFDDLSTIANDTIGHTVHPWDLQDDPNDEPILKIYPYTGTGGSAANHLNTITSVNGIGSLPHSKLPAELMEGGMAGGGAASGSGAGTSGIYSPYGDDSNYNGSAGSIEKAQREKRQRRRYLIAAIVGPIVSALIVGLSVGFVFLQKNQSEKSASAAIKPDEPSTPPFTFPSESPSTMEPSQSPVMDGAPTRAPSPIAPTRAPEAPQPTLRPVATPTLPPVPGPTQPPMATPTQPPVIPPTAAPVAAPTPVETPEEADSFLVLASQSSDALEVALSQKNNPESPQAQSISWLTQDPNYWDYPDTQKVQRYALAVLVNGWQKIPYNSWLSYETHECTWRSSSTSPCDSDTNSIYETLDLRRSGAGGGPLPMEISLLTSLRFLYLQANSLTGRLPTELATMTQLERVQLTNNLLSGTLPTEMGRLLTNNLSVLGLGRNQFRGSIPTSWAVGTTLQTLGLERNLLTGSIPAALGNVPSLSRLYLDGNEFVGQIPSNLWDLPLLEQVNLGSNDLQGSIGGAVCQLATLQELVADCEAKVKCDCCTECSDAR